MTFTTTRPTEVEEELSLNEERELAGVTPELQLIPPEYQIESAETSQERNAAERPSTRMAMVLALGGVGIGTLGIAYFTLINPKAPTPTVKAQTTAPPVPTTLPDSSAEYKSKLALVDQKSQIGQRDQPKPSPTITPGATNPSPNKTAPRQITVPNTSYTPAPGPTSSSFTPIRTTDRPINTTATSIPTRTATIAASHPPTAPIASVAAAKPALTPTKTATAEEQTPEQTWTETANLGSYSSNASVTEKPSATLASYRPSQPNSQQLIVGSRSWGRLETPLEWGSTNSNQRFLVKLETPMLANDGKVALPTGSTLVVEAKTRANSSTVDIFATSALVTVNGTAVEYPLNPGAIVVLKEDGKLFRGKAKKQNQFERNIGQSLLSGVSKATSLANQSTSQSTFSTGNSFSNVTTNPPPNYLSGFVSGTTNNLVQNLQRSDNNSNYNSEDRSSYSIAAGTKVLIFVNNDTQIDPPPTAEVNTEVIEPKLSPVPNETVSPAPIPSVSTPPTEVVPRTAPKPMPNETATPAPIPSVSAPPTEVVPKAAPKPVITLVENPQPTNITAETAVAPETVPNTRVEVTPQTPVPTASSTGILTSALESSTAARDQNHLIKLTAPLISADGKTAINQGSYLIAKIIPSTDSKQLQLTATSALVRNNGVYQEQSLPCNVSCNIDTADNSKSIPSGTFAKIELVNGQPQSN